ncbi:MAG: hypothetical protein WC472_02055 [Candidatus Paceibacterota bacterium]
MKQVILMGIAIKTRMIGSVLILIAIPYFGFLLANISKTNESLRMLVGSLLATGIVLLIGSTPCIDV